MHVPRTRNSQRHDVNFYKSRSAACLLVETLCYCLLISLNMFCCSKKNARVTLTRQHAHWLMVENHSFPESHLLAGCGDTHISSSPALQPILNPPIAVDQGGVGVGGACNVGCPLDGVEVDVTREDATANSMAAPGDYPLHPVLHCTARRIPVLIITDLLCVYSLLHIEQCSQPMRIWVPIGPLW